MRKIFVIFITFYVINLQTGLGRKSPCSGNEEKCAPYFTDPMEANITEKQGADHTFYCNADGKPDPNFTWMKDGVIEKNHLNDSWQFRNLQPTHSGNYSCHVCNELGCINFTYQLTVKEKPFKFEKELENGTAQIGKSHIFHCQTNKKSDLDWYPHTKEMIIANYTRNTPDYMLELRSKYHTQIYKIDSVSKEDEGWYLCLATDDTGKIIQSRGYLTVVPAPSDDSDVMLLISASVLIIIMIICGFLWYYYNYVKFTQSSTDLIKKHTKFVQKIYVREIPDYPEKLDFWIEYQLVPIHPDSNESETAFETVRYEVKLDGIRNISRNFITLATRIGRGAYGHVYRAEVELESNTKITVAVKMLENNNNTNAVLDLLSEMKIMQAIGEHENVINLFGCCGGDGRPLWLLMEYATFGNLRDFIIDRMKNNELDEKTLLGFARQIAEGMKFLASKNVIHRDLSARNVLVSKELVMKIADFGLSRRYIHEKGYYRRTENKNKIPIKWMAPEALYHQRYTTKSDVWSFGILLWEMMSMGDLPYGTMTPEEVFHGIKKGLRLGKPENCSKETYNLMFRCWNNDAQKRPDFSEILQELDIIIEGFNEGRSTSTVRSNSSISSGYVEVFT